MKQLQQLALIVIAVIGLFLIMSYTRPAADEPKEYIVVHVLVLNGKTAEFEKEVNNKIGEGWHPIGGVAQGNGSYSQAMVK